MVKGPLVCLLRQGLPKQPLPADLTTKILLAAQPPATCAHKQAQPESLSACPLACLPLYTCSCNIDVTSIWAALAAEYIKSPIDNHQYTIAIHLLIENHKRKPKPQKPDPFRAHGRKHIFQHHVLESGLQNWGDGFCTLSDTITKYNVRGRKRKETQPNRRTL